MKKCDQTLEICKQSFLFLKSEYDFSEFDEVHENWGFSIRYKNQSTGITLKYEMREFYVFVAVTRLMGNSFPQQSGEIRSDTVLNTFDLDDIVALRASSQMVNRWGDAKKMDLRLFKSSTDKQSQNLKIYAGDILRGDFSLFPELDRIVKARAREASIQRWGFWA